MSAPRAPSSDLELARSLSRRLRESRDAPTTKIEPSPRYLRFDARRAAPESWLSPLSRMGAPFGADVWNELLDGCLSAADATGAFLMDAQGLVVATRGTMKQDAAESIGGRLMGALDQIELIGSSTTAVSFEVDGGWLTGLRSTQKSASPLTLALLAPAPLSRAAREVVEGLLATAITE